MTTSIQTQNPSPPIKTDFKTSLTRIAINLDRNKPFFGYLYKHLTCKIDYNLPAVAGVTSTGVLYLNPDKIKTYGLTERALEGVLCHEILHVVLRTGDRQNNRQHDLWNIATDLAINTILLQSNEVVLPENAIKPNKSYGFVFENIIITDIRNKCAEQIYDELVQNIPRGRIRQVVGPLIRNEIDTHERWDQQDDTGNASSSDTKKMENYWKEKLILAAEIAKHRGRLPAGIWRQVEQLTQPKTNWRDQFRYCLGESLQNENTWHKPNRKYLSRRLYLPGRTSKSVDMVVHMDTSGSISSQNIKDFITELTGVFTGDVNVTMTLLIGDAQIQDIITCNSQEELLNAVGDGVRGGGGTSHIPIINWILANKPDCKLFISMTDGDSDIQKCYPQLPETCRKVLVLSDANMFDNLKNYVDDCINID